MTGTSRIGSALWKIKKNFFYKILFMWAIVIYFNGLSSHEFLVPILCS